jgi:hypothetical protein
MKFYDRFGNIAADVKKLLPAGITKSRKSQLNSVIKGNAPFLKNLIPRHPAPEFVDFRHAISSLSFANSL